MSILCGADNSCPFLYDCKIQTNQCEHVLVFPLLAYPLIIYLLFPICSALCNLTGASFGQFKVLLLMDCLNYTQNQATTLTYALITGTGLINTLVLIPKRHPTRDTSLVDFNIIMILIPNVLFGSTIGSLVNNFIPPLAADICIFLIFLGFAIKFCFILKGLRQDSKLNRTIDEQQFTEKTLRSQSQKPHNSNINPNIMLQLKLVPSKTDHLHLSNNQNAKGNPNSYVQAQKAVQIRKSQFQEQQKVINMFQQQLDQKLQYESTFHLPHIIATIIVFAIFQFLVFLAQGKIHVITKFSICSSDYFIGIGSLAAIYLTYLICVYFYTRRQMSRFRRIRYQYNGNLDIIGRYAIVCAAGFIGGFNSGAFGLGSSVIMIFALLFLGFEPAVVSATVGFQVFFSGAASLAQALALQQISLETAGFFFGQTFILGGVLTIIARYQIEKYNVDKVNQILIFIIAFFCFVNVIASPANIVIGLIEFGLTFMTSIRSC